jgi:hypothetical protein
MPLKPMSTANTRGNQPTLVVEVTVYLPLKAVRLILWLGL